MIKFGYEVPQNLKVFWVYQTGYNIVSAAASVPCVILDDCQQKVDIYKYILMIV